MDMAASVQDTVFYEPILHLPPGILRRLHAIALPVVGKEAMARARVDFEFCDFPSRFQLLLHRLDLVWRYSGVLGAIEAKHRCLDFVCKIKSVLRHGCARRIHEASVKRDTCLEAGVMRCIE